MPVVTQGESRSARAPLGKVLADMLRSEGCEIDWERISDEDRTSRNRTAYEQGGDSRRYRLSANIWITDMANFAEMNAVWDAWVSPGNTPARATVEAKLASPDYKVEIMVVAAR
jgi:Endoribonuclease L-PSP